MAPKNENSCSLTDLNQKVLQAIKKSFEDVHSDATSIEFHLPHYEILQLSSHYQKAKKTRGAKVPEEGAASRESHHEAQKLREDDMGYLSPSIPAGPSPGGYGNYR